MMRTMTCRECGVQFELRPGKLGFANVCEDCSGVHRAAPAPVVFKAGPVRKPEPRKRSPEAHQRALRRAFVNLAMLGELNRRGR